MKNQRQIGVALVQLNEWELARGGTKKVLRSFSGLSDTMIAQRLSFFYQHFALVGLRARGGN